MTAVEVPDKALLQDWLDQSGTQYYQCGHCEGLHIHSLKETLGVNDSRLFLEDYGLLLSTELEVRHTALLQLSADLGRLNMQFPTLKIFLDIVDEAMPQLVAAGLYPVAAGLTQEQFDHYIAITAEATARLAEECGELNYLFGAVEPGPGMLH